MTPRDIDSAILSTIQDGMGYMELSEAMASIGIRWQCTTRLDTLRQDTHQLRAVVCQWWSKTGFREIMLGVR